MFILKNSIELNQLLEEINTLKKEMKELKTFCEKIKSEKEAFEMNVKENSIQLDGNPHSEGGIVCRD
jgi:hypothetical protein